MSNHKHYPRKRFGQNFLHDNVIIQKIVSAISPKYSDHLIEIGPGLGALTKHILPLVQTMEAIELDRDLIPKLQQQFAHQGQLTIFAADALSFDFSKLKINDKKLRLIGNLPYNISTPLLFHLFDQQECIEDMHFMLQREVANRLAAKPATKTYGRLSVMSQYYCEIQTLFSVSPEAFRPVPKVYSTFVRLIPHRKLPHIAKNPLLLSEIVKQAFTHRRKILRNCLQDWLTEAQFLELGIDPKLRPEQLSVESFVKISNMVGTVPLPLKK